MKSGNPQAASESGAVPARAIWFGLLAHAVAIALLSGLMIWVNTPVRDAVVSGSISMGIAADNARLVGMIVWLALALIEFTSAMWLIYSVMLPRVWPEAKRRLSQDGDEWSKEDMIILLLVVFIVLLIVN